MGGGGEGGGNILMLLFPKPIKVRRVQHTYYIDTVGIAKLLKLHSPMKENFAKSKQLSRIGSAYLT